MLSLCMVLPLDMIMYYKLSIFIAYASKIQTLCTLHMSSINFWVYFEGRNLTFEDFM